MEDRRSNPSLNNNDLDYCDDDGQSFCAYDIPYLNTFSQDSPLSEFVKSQSDRLLFSSTPTNIPKGKIPRTTSMRVEKPLTSSSLTKYAYNLKRSQSLFANFSYSYYSCEETEIKPYENYSSDDDEESLGIVSSCMSSSDDTVEMAIGKDDHLKNEGDMDRQMVTIKGESSKDSIESSHILKKNHRNFSTRKVKRFKPKWLHRSVSDSVDKKNTKETINVAQRSTLFSRFRNDRQKIIGGSGSGDSRVPLVITNHFQEDSSSQSSNSLEASMSSKSKIMSCLTGMTSPRIIGREKTPKKNMATKEIKQKEMDIAKPIKKEMGQIKKNVKNATPRRKKINMKSQKEEDRIPETVVAISDDEVSITSYASTRTSKKMFSPREIATSPRFRVMKVDDSPEKLMSAKTNHESDYASDCASVTSYSSASSIYTDASSIRDPFARRSKTVQRSRRLKKVTRSDGDVWIEKLFVSKKTGKKRIYFVSVKTGARVRDEPPSGASQVLYAEDLVHRNKQIDSIGPETIYLCMQMKKEGKN